jgi:rhamnosyltransferase
VILAQSAGWNTLVLGSQPFNHGGTRQWAVEQVGDGVELVVLMTQDALLANPTALSQLLLPFADPQVGVVYGRQLPHANASLLAAKARFFNYPERSFVNTFDDRERLGLRAAFCSDSFAAYRLSHYNAVGGFPMHVIMGEDMWVAAKMLMAGFKVAYAAEALVYHSHNYGLREEFQRYFDTGVFHAQEPWLIETFGSVKREGLKMLRSQLLGPESKTNKRNWTESIPDLEQGFEQYPFNEQLQKIHSSRVRRWCYFLEVLSRTTVKLIGYRLGRAYYYWPRWVIKGCSSFKNYW